jgi:hypothetical protein
LFLGRPDTPIVRTNCPFYLVVDISGVYILENTPPPPGGDINQGCGTGKFEDSSGSVSGSDILSEYGSGSSSGSGSYSYIHIYEYIYIYVYIFANVYVYT